MKFHLNIRLCSHKKKNTQKIINCHFFYSEGGQKLEQVDHSGCAVSTSEDTQNVPGHAPGQPAPAAPALSRGTG